MDWTLEAGFNLSLWTLDHTYCGFEVYSVSLYLSILYVLSLFFTFLNTYTYYIHISYVYTYVYIYSIYIHIYMGHIYIYIAFDISNDSPEICPPGIRGGWEARWSEPPVAASPKCAPWVPPLQRSEKTTGVPSMFKTPCFSMCSMLRKTTGDIISDVGWKSAENYLQLWFHTSCWNIVETLLKHGLTWVCVQMLNTLFCRLNQCCSQLEFVYPDVNYIVLLDPPAEKCLFSGRSPCGWCQVISTSPLGRKISPWPWGEEWPWEHHGDHIDTASCGDVERDETRQ